MSLGTIHNPDDAPVYDECIENSCVRLNYGDGLDFSGCDDRDEVRERLKASARTIEPLDYRVTSVHTFKNKMQEGDLVVVSDGNRRFRAIGRIAGPYQYVAEEPFYHQMRPVEWLLICDPSRPRERILKKVFSQATIYELKPAVLKLDALHELLAGSTTRARQNYVMIIDEINRGNIAKILGELITLLEPDKRLDAENEITVTLPYSEESFGVPGNLFIIGTMNTADRSIAFLDVALRRRFRFDELMPDPEVLRQLMPNGGKIDGVDLPALLRTINERIEVLYDRDHQIGHSYFLGVRSLADLRDVFVGKVVPLLQEYFYGDWEKVCHVLGCPLGEDGAQVLRGSDAIIVAAALDSRALLGEPVDDIESRPRCVINPQFASATQGLAPYFNTICQNGAAGVGAE